jgi:putative ABC transport system permease protein
MLAKNPGFTAVAVLTLALGIGANTAIFSVVNAVLLRPLPFPEPDRLVRVVSVRLRDNAGGNASYPDFLDWRAHSHVFDHMAAFHSEDFILTGRGEAAHLSGAVVSADLFSVLGVRPSLGRSFLTEEDQPGATNGGDPVILSHRLWQQRFGGEAGVVGQSIQLASKSCTIVGVMPAGFQFQIEAEPTELWTTIARDNENGEKSIGAQRGAHYLDVIARLKPQVSRAQAQAEMSTLVSALNLKYPENSPRGARVVPELEQETGPIRPVLWILLGTVGCVLLIACANVANLLLARSTARHQEMAIRGALGADRARLVRQLLTESIALASVGGVFGMLLALWGIDVLLRLLPVPIPRLTYIHLDARVLIFTLVLSLITGLVFGLAPALQVSRSNVAESLKEGGRGSTEGSHRNRVRGALVVVQVAVATVLLVGAGLLIQSFLRLQRVDPGFDPHHALVFNLDLPSQYSAAQMFDLYQQIVARATRVPGVRSSSAVMPLPLSGNDVKTGFDIEGRPVAAANRPSTTYTWTLPGYFHTLGIPLLLGRDFSAQDDLKANPVVIVSETLARQFFPNQNAIGKRIKPGIGNGYKDGPPMREIVGVVADVKNSGLRADPLPETYVPLAQSPMNSMSIVLRTEVEPLGVVRAARNEVAAIDKNLSIYNVKTLDQYLSDSVAVPQFISLMLGIFAGAALLLAAVGLYGVVSYSVTQRTHEIGIRMALGAKRLDVLSMVVRQGLVLTFIGLVAGLAGAVAFTRFLASLLYDVRPTDPGTFAAVAFILAAVACGAAFIPARRATRVDPMVALRHE